MPILHCADAVRSADGDPDQELEYLRQVYRQMIIDRYGGLNKVTWEYPRGLQ